MEPYGITIFCDDIRTELHGKVTLVGIYGSELLLYGDFPAVLPKLCLFVQVRFPPVKIDSARILVYAPWIEDGSPIYTYEFPKSTEDYTQQLPASVPENDSIRTISINHPIIFSPLVLTTEGLIKVRAEINDKLIKAGTLKLTKSVPPAAGN